VFTADETGAQICGDPLALATALRKIECWSQNPQAAPMQSGTPATAHMMIVNPFTGGGLVQLFSTHPATRLRVDRLEVMARGSQPLSLHDVVYTRGA
jgi:heat shock protein HtpX